MPADSEFDLATYYLNQRRLAELAGAEAIGHAVSRAGGAMSARAQANVEMAACKDVLLSWLRSNRDVVRPLDELLLLDRVRPGIVFTVARDFYCRGVRGVRPSPAPTMRGKIPTIGRQVALRFRLDRGHVAPGSPGDLLSGHTSELFVVGVVEGPGEAEVSATPIFIGKTIAPSHRETIPFPAECEVHIDSIESFEQCRLEPVPGLNDLGLLRQVSEESVKGAFAEIIGEPVVPRDWGGEHSDLFSSYVHLNGSRVSTAFVFKGPSRWHPMSLADLGLRGDQIVRVMCEPADLFILQHCHQVRAEVRHMLRTYARDRRRRCCVINGFDTLRILRAYGKCGFVPTARA